MPLAEKTMQVVEATAPAVAKAGPALTAAFYKRMFSNNPELNDIFNMAHQRNLAQPKALFDSVVAYATHLRELEALGPAIERIAYKHTSFDIRRDQYQIVGYNLLKTIEEQLNPGDEVLAEWGKAYEFLADVLATREEQIYDEVANMEGGFRPTRQFKVAEKVKLNDLIVRFKLVPADGKPVVAHKPGQYLAIFARHPSMPYQEIRQYSIVSAPNHEFYEVALKRHDQGQVSRYMQDKVNVGDVLNLAPPYGDFHIADNLAAETPVVMLSGGIGQTPVMSMLRTFAEKKDTRPLHWLHGAHDSSVRAFGQEVRDIQAKALPQLKSFTWLSKVDDAKDKPTVDFDFKGRMDLSQVPEIFKNKAAEYYFVGPESFMASVNAQLEKNGVEAKRIHFECFGPFKPLE